MIREFLEDLIREDFALEEIYIMSNAEFIFRCIVLRFYYLLNDNYD